MQLKQWQSSFGDKHVGLQSWMHVLTRCNEQGVALWDVSHPSNGVLDAEPGSRNQEHAIRMPRR